ncbi:MAG: class I SAM-dependent methyltransferase [Actinomycetales bacterium]
MTEEPRNWSDRADELAADAIAAGEPTAWFEQLYAEGVAGSTALAWDRETANPLMLQWFDEHQDLREGSGKKAVVVGAGLGADAARVASLGYDTTAFDVSPTAVRLASERVHGVHFQIADLFELPAEWRRSFDLVVEIYTVQALPRDLRTRAVAAVRDLLATGGTACVIQASLGRGDSADDGPPWPFTRDEIDQFAGEGVELADLQPVASDGGPFATHWMATLTRR